MRPPRVGHGFDAHRLVSGRKLILGGVDIPHDKGLEGHSDADALVHAIVDAMVGGMGLGDIGTYFPPTDPANKDQSSLKFLARARELVDEGGYAVANVDTTIVAEAPRLAPYIQQMKKNIAEVLEIPETQVNVKSTTTDGLGYTGAHEGLAVHAVTLLLEKEELVAW